MNDEIVFILERFPSHRSAILNAYKTNEEFKSLCDDFYSTAKTLETYHQKRLKEVKNELEYRNLFVDLERELLVYLTKKMNTSKKDGTADV